MTEHIWVGSLKVLVLYPVHLCFFMVSFNFGFVFTKISSTGNVSSVRFFSRTLFGF